MPQRQPVGARVRGSPRDYRRGDARVTRRSPLALPTPQLTRGEALAVMRYQIGSAMFNNPLRSGSPLVLKPILLEALDSIFAEKAPRLERQTTVYRAVPRAVSDGLWTISSTSPHEYHDPAFLSATPLRAGAERFGRHLARLRRSATSVLTIVMPPGTPVLHLNLPLLEPAGTPSSWAYFSTIPEWLFPRGLRFHVRSDAGNLVLLARSGSAADAA